MYTTCSMALFPQYGISQPTSHQRSCALADCFDCRDVIIKCGQKLAHIENTLRPYEKELYQNICDIYLKYIAHICKLYVFTMSVYVSYMYMLHICRIRSNIYMWHICKYMGSIWDWWKEKKTSKPTASLWNWPIKLNWSSLNREMDACLWEDMIVFDFVHFIHIQASLSYNHIYMFCITLLYICILGLHLFALFHWLNSCKS